MDASKSLLQSRTLWGLAVAILATVLQRWGFAVSAADQQQLVELLLTLGQLGGAGLAIWGRIAATHRLGVPGQTPRLSGQ